TITFHIQYDAGDFWVDGVRFYEGDYVPPVFQKRTAATDPAPGDGATDVPRDVELSWRAGELAGSHDVYFGTSFDDVNNASVADPMGVLASEGQAGITFDPEGLLEYSQTYYWRVDEVNATPDKAVFKGNTWSFTAEPFVYPLQNIVATASSSEAGAGPENTVNGSGLNASDQHSIEATDMWLSNAAGAQPTWIQYEFDAVYKLSQMSVWNYNVQFELVLGFGLKDVTVEYSTDGAEWTILGDYEFAQGTARSGYAANTVVDLDGVVAKYVRLTANSNWGGMLPQFGLSEVRFLYKPVVAREPTPADGAVDVDLDLTLDWRDGREVAAHEVYLSTDRAAVEAGTALVDSVSESRYAATGLELGTTYYWKVNEVNEAATPTVWEGGVWSFSTLEFLVVEDFESYNDDDNRIYETWIDGWVNDTGSTVGYLDAPFAERVIVRDGRQSMPLFYDNTGVATAETEYEPTLTNWAGSGVQSLSLYFYGTPGNTGQLYAEINGTRVDYDGDAADISRATWQPWNIDLSTVGNVSNVRTLIIGVEGAGASGTLYIDSIRLYPNAPEYVVPAEPDTANLVAHYALNGDVTDASGNGYNGTANGDPIYGAGMDGQAIELDGADDYVVVAGVGIDVGMARTVSGWAKASATGINAWTGVFGFTGPSGNGGHFDIEAVGDTADTTLGYYGVHRYGWERDIRPIDLEWHHLAATFDGETVAWYGDGLIVGSVAVAAADVTPPGQVHIGKREDNDNYFPGLLDEVRVYNRALSAEEIAWLAGKRTPAHKPF
ncbi:MAG: discoidin domain-containing protein, partial [Phycisphaerales bacterium]